VTGQIAYGTGGNSYDAGMFRLEKIAAAAIFFAAADGLFCL
jgi:hypothetical protein